MKRLMILTYLRIRKYSKIGISESVSKYNLEEQDIYSSQKDLTKY